MVYLTPIGRFCSKYAHSLSFCGGIHSTISLTAALALKEQCHDLVVKARAGCSFIHSSVQRLERYEKPGKGGRDKYDKTQFRAVLVYL
eukprot:scaffold2113_cov146-Skeletonema_menzelii.AAC.17